VTSLALALRSDAGLVRAKVARHIAMIGNIEARGNTTPHSEFNAWCDPEALAIVLAAELPTELIGLDVTRKLVVNATEVYRLAHAGNPLANWMHDALRFYLEFHRQYEKLEGVVVNDVLAIAALLQPDVLDYQELRLTVDLDDGDDRGRTRVDRKGSQARVALQVRPEPVREMLFERVLPWLVKEAADV
jgi:purine nucleosidase